MSSNSGLKRGLAVMRFWQPASSQY